MSIESLEKEIMRLHGEISRLPQERRRKVQEYILTEMEGAVVKVRGAKVLDYRKVRAGDLEKLRAFLAE